MPGTERHPHPRHTTRNTPPVPSNPTPTILDTTRPPAHPCHPCHPCHPAINQPINHHNTRALDCQGPSRKHTPRKPRTPHTNTNRLNKTKQGWKTTTHTNQKSHKPRTHTQRPGTHSPDSQKTPTVFVQRGMRRSRTRAFSRRPAAQTSCPAGICMPVMAETCTSSNEAPAVDP